MRISPIPKKIRSREAVSKTAAIVIAVIILVAIVAGVTYYVTRPPPVPERTEIVIGASVSLTGPLAYFGYETKWAYEKAVESVNKEGGIYVAEYGRKLPIRLIIYDDKSDPTVRASNVEKLCTVDKVDVILGSVGTTLMLAGAPIIEKYGVPCVSSGVASVKLHQMGYKYIFTNFMLSYDQFLIFFKWWETLPEDQRPRTIAIWEEATEHGHENAEYMEKFAKEYGYEVVLREKYAPGADFTSLIQKTKALNPDVVMALPTGTDAINMIRQAKELDFCPKVWALSYGTAMSGFGEALGKDADYVFASFSYHKSLPFSVNREIVAEYIEETGKEPTLLGCWYASAEILFDAIKRAGSLDKEKIRQALLETDLETCMGRVKFNEDGSMKDSWKLTYILQWQHEKLELVWPPDVATSQIWYPTPPWGERG